MYHNPAKREYIFSYSDDDKVPEHFVYYLPYKKQYTRLLHTKIDDIKICGHGRVEYEDGKTYYYVSIKKKKEGI